MAKRGKGYAKEYGREKKRRERIETRKAVEGVKRPEPTPEKLAERVADLGERWARGKDGEIYNVPGNMTYDEWQKIYLSHDGEKAIIDLQKELGIKGTIRLSNKNFDLDTFDIDYDHIESRHCKISVEEMNEFLNESVFSVERWNGKSLNYYSPKGAIYIDPVNHKVKTAFRVEEYDDKTLKLMEAITHVIRSGH